MGRRLLASWTACKNGNEISVTLHWSLDKRNTVAAGLPFCVSRSCQQHPHPSNIADTRTDTRTFLFPSSLHSVDVVNFLATHKYVVSSHDFFQKNQTV